MARNEEKQLGRLNRVWLQREREEGRVKDISTDRPRLGALHTAAEVKKWIPSIKQEIEYYLEQSQLIHYSDRKIEEFREKIEVLKKDYQSHLWKLRRLDPAHKEHPWKPRGYTRKRSTEGKVPAWVKADGESDSKLLRLPVLLESNSQEKESDSEEEETSPKREDPPAVPPPPLPDLPENQDLPLVFNTAKSQPRDLWERWFSHTASRAANQPHSTLGNKMEDSKMGGAPTDGRSQGLLGLACYSSSEEES